MDKIIVCDSNGNHVRKAQAADSMKEWFDAQASINIIDTDGLELTFGFDSDGTVVVIGFVRKTEKGR